MAKLAEEPQRADESLDAALKRLLAARGRSLRWLAGELGRDVGYLSRAIRGVGKPMASPELVREIAAILGVEPEWFGRVRESELTDAIRRDARLRDRLFAELKSRPRR